MGFVRICADRRWTLPHANENPALRQTLDSVTQGWRAGGECVSLKPMPMKTWKQDDGRWLACQSLPLADRGFRYGMGMFETIAVSEGRALLVEAHLERLARAAMDFGAPSPALPPFDVSDLGTGLLRIYLTAGVGAPDAPFKGDAYALFDNAEVGWNLPPLRIATSAAPYLPRPGGWKTCNYWQNIDALAAARRLGCDDALLLNPAGILVGASMANVFLCIDGSWITPALETGARDGVVRSWTLQHLQATEELIDPSIFKHCTAAFLTNSRIGIRPAGELDGRPLVDACATLRKSYFDEVFCA